MALCFAVLLFGPSLFSQSSTPPLLDDNTMHAAPPQDRGGVLPALQRLSYAGKALDDAQRTLAHYGVDYWAARFPHWPLTIRRREFCVLRV
jgi:hypothetical protein